MSSTPSKAFLGGALAGAAAALTGALLYSRHTNSETSPSHAEQEEQARMAVKGKVWSCIGGAMQSAQLYLGDRLKLYTALRDLCSNGTSCTTARALAEKTELSERWVTEWCAQQAAMGILELQPAAPGTEDGVFGANLLYRLPEAACDVLANPESTYYDIGMIQGIPALVNRARTVMPECFKTGIGRPYDEQDVATGIDRHHAVQIRDKVLPLMIPKAADGSVDQKLMSGVLVAELGCGGGNLLIAMAKRYPKSTFTGYEVSDPALELAKSNVLESGVKNVRVVDAREAPLGDSGPFDIVTTFDVLHDAPYPSELIQQVKKALTSDGTWLLGDMAGKDSVRDNICHNAAAPVMFSFSTCLCMSCATTEPDGEALGTLGFNVEVAKRMLNKGGFSKVEVLLEYDMTRWFEVAH